MSNIELKCTRCGGVETHYGTTVVSIPDDCQHCGRRECGFEVSVVDT